MPYACRAYSKSKVILKSKAVIGSGRPWNLESEDQSRVVAYAAPQGQTQAEGQHRKTLRANVSASSNFTTWGGEGLQGLGIHNPLGMEGRNQKSGGLILGTSILQSS